MPWQGVLKEKKMQLIVSLFSCLPFSFLIPVLDDSTYLMAEIGRQEDVRQENVGRKRKCNLLLLYFPDFHFPVLFPF
jgi:hypothetical protein